MLTTVLFLALGAAPTPAEYVTSLEGAPVLSLEEVERMVVDENFDVRIARQRLERSAILSKKAYSVILPSVNASYNYAINREIIFPFEGDDLVVQQRTQQSADITFSWTVLSGRSLPLIMNAYDAVDQSVLQYEQQKETLVYAASLAYFNSLTASRTLEIRTRALEIAKRNAELAGAQAELGSASSVDTLRAEVAVATAEQDLIQAQIGKLLTDRSLAVLINRIDERGQLDPFQVQRPAPPVLSETDLLDEALSQRLDLKIATLDLSIAERLVDESYTKFLPELVVTGGAFWNEVAGFTGVNTNWNVTLSAQWALFEGGQTYWELRERKYDLETAAIAIEQSKVRIADNVEQSRLNLANAQSNYEAALRRVDLARRSSELAQAQFEVGSSTQLEVLDANRSLADAEASEALGQLRVDLARLELERVVKIDPSTANGGGAAQTQTTSATDSLTATVAGDGGQQQQ